MDKVVCLPFSKKGGDPAAPSGTATLQVRPATSGIPNSGGVTGGVYKARELIHRAILMRDY